MLKLCFLRREAYIFTLSIHFQFAYLMHYQSTYLTFKTFWFTYSPYQMSTNATIIKTRFTKFLKFMLSRPNNLVLLFISIITYIKGFLYASTNFNLLWPFE